MKKFLKGFFSFIKQGRNLYNLLQFPIFFTVGYVGARALSEEPMTVSWAMSGLTFMLVFTTAMFFVTMGIYAILRDK